MITIANALTFTTGGVLGYLIRTLVDHRLARSRSTEAINITEYSKAANALRTELIKHRLYMLEIIDMYVFGDDIGFNIADAEIAKNLFEVFLKKSTRTRFNDAWHNFMCPIKKNTGKR